MCGRQLGFRALLLVSKSASGLLASTCSKGVASGIIGRELSQLPVSLRSSLCTTSSSSESAASATLLARGILQQASVKKLKDDLEKDAESSMCIPFEKFVDRAKSSGAAKNEQEAAKICEALQASGVLLRHNDLVYLRVHEILDQVAEVMPVGIQDARAKLMKIEEELSELDKKMGQAHGRAELVTNLMLGSGFIILFTQFLAFIYLTWWELSWDVMEPFGYIIQLFYSLVAYAYFLTMRGAIFDLGPFRDFWMVRIMKSKMTQLHLDEDRYKYLQQLRDRYRRHICARSFRV